jgi:hypothetical protein
MQLFERYNKALRLSEDVTILQLNRILDNSFNRLIRRTRIQIRSGKPAADRNMALLQEFRQLVPAFNPQRTDAYDRVLRGLLRSSQQKGIGVARDSMRKLTPSRRRIGVSIPIEATVAAAAQSKGYLRRHGETFAETATELVAQGVAEGRPTDVITNDLRLRLGVVKSRADVIARTESLRAYNNASNQYYAANGIDLPICNARAARIYKRAETQAPCHPRCRCYLAPWDPEIAAIDDDYASLPRRHREEVSKVTTVGPADLNKASVFEQFAPQPLDLT